MKNISVTALTSNKEVLESARITVWKETIDKEPSEVFMILPMMYSVKSRNCLLLKGKSIVGRI